MTRLLLVDDEALIALEMEAHLCSLGYSIIGPFARLDKVLKAISTQAFDGAVLDINIRGGLIYPVAEILMERAIPFLLITGYAECSIEEKFRKCPILHKPFTMRSLTQKINIIFGELTNA
ncbi:MAG TPA: response regulator [Methylomirabilota bacterium]|nr:response regulator [Methylomirabilota bacterium]